MTATSTDSGAALAATEHKALADCIRVLAMDAVQKAKSGHPGMPMGMADAAVVLFSEFLNFDATAPDWADRDRFILSAGHGSMLLYALLHLTGSEVITLEELKNFRQLGSKTAGHPEFGEAPGIETTTGPLGQGFANGVGMAMAERHLNAKFGDELVDHRTWVIAGDGCLMEGISHESASLAGHLGLGRLNVLWDDNRISIDGSTDLTLSDDVKARFASYGWHVVSAEGHDPASLRAAMAEAQNDPRPSLIACRTTIGFGSPNKGGTSGSHGAPLGDEEIALTREALGWTAGPFEIPAEVAAIGRSVGTRGKAAREAWEGRLGAASHKDEFQRLMSGELPKALDEAVLSYKKALVADMPKLATRVASQKALEVLAPAVPELLGGSADLTGSNNTKVADLGIFDKNNAAGRYVHYGVREHGMAAAMNGMALHGGVIPYGGTFLVFTDYCRPSIRLAALMGIRSIFVMTHDSIGLGEDGPTHQPAEHMAALRAIPNLLVFRPADAMETLECWELAVRASDRPSVLALTRQGLPAMRDDASAENKSAAGAYVLREEGSDHKVTLLASGSEVEIAAAAQDALEAEGIGTRLVSVPSLETFLTQPLRKQSKVLGNAEVRVAVEAGISMPWLGLLGAKGAFVGMDSFGASAPYQALYQHFGITAEAVADKARSLLG